MTLVANTTPVNAIASLSDLIDEIRDELDDAEFSETKILRAIARAEALFNRRLRTPYMETQASVASSTENVALPTDFLELRRIYNDDAVDCPLIATSPEALRRLYGGTGGVPTHYAIEGRRILVAPVGEVTVNFLYYAKIPALNSENPTNWLLEQHPDLYLHMALSILFNKLGDNERGALNYGLSEGFISEINIAASQARWGGAPIRPSHIRQVRGARI